MLVAFIEDEPKLMPCAEVSDEHLDHASTPEQTGLHLCPAVDAGPGAPQPGEYRTPICAAGQGARHGLAAEVDPRARSRPRHVRGTECRSRGLQDVGGGRIDGPGRSGVCPGGVALGAIEPRLASAAGTVCPDAYLGDRRRRLLRSGG